MDSHSGESSTSTPTQPPNPSILEIEVAEDQIQFQEHEDEVNPALPIRSRHAIRGKNILFFLIECTLGILIGYETTIAGGAVAGNEFMTRVFPVVVRGKALIPQDNYCAYSSPFLKFFTSMLQISAFIMICCTAFAKWRLARCTLKQLLLAGSVAHLIGSVTNGSGGSILPILFLGRALQGAGLGILIQAADLSLQKLPKELIVLQYAHISSIVLGPSVASVVNLILSNQGVNGAWRVSFSISGVLSLLLIAFSIPLDEDFRNDVDQRELKRSWSSLWKAFRPQLVIAAIKTIIVPLTDLNLYSTVLLMYFDSNNTTTYVVPLGLSLGDAVGKLISHFMMRRYRRRALLVSCCVTIITQISLGTLLHFALLRGSDKEVSGGVGILALILESIFMLCRTPFAYPLGWLRFGHQAEVEIASSAIMGMLDMLVQTIIVGFASYIVCSLGSVVFYILASILVLVMLFVVVGVPETSNIETEEQQQEVLRSFKIWKCIH